MRCRRLSPLPARELAGGLSLAVALSPRARLLGLALLAELPAAQGLLIPRCRSVHTFGMRFALDVLFLDEHGGVVRLDREVPPGRMARCGPASAVVETRAGEGERFAAALSARGAATAGS
jgi:uncharacterized membrane protein (UPF0127 family)